MINYGNRGKWFEKAIEQTNMIYKNKGIAIIDKIATPVNYNTRTNKAFYEGKSTVDFIGCDFNGKLVAFDAKETSQKNIPLANIKQHQIDYLMNVSKLGASAFFLIFFKLENKCYKLDIHDFMIFKQTAKRKSIPFEWFESNAKEIVSKNGCMFDYL